MGPCTFPQIFVLHWLTRILPPPLFPRYLCCVVISAGDENGTAEHDPDFLRDHRPSCPVSTLENTEDAVTQCDSDTSQERSCPAHQYIRRGWRAVLLAQCQVKVCEYGAFIFTWDIRLI